MPMQLLITDGPDRGRVVPLVDGQTLLVGRGLDSDTQLQDLRVSRKHFQIQVDGHRVELTDLGSSSGTNVNNEQVTQTELRPGDIIRIGDTEFQFQIEGMAGQSTLVSRAAEPATPTPTESHDLSQLVGKTIHDYRVETILAKGKTGMVFKAHDTKRDRDLALKVMWPALSKNDEEMQRFVRAMKTMSPVRHPNIVRIYNAGKTGPHVWVSLEFVDGESLTHVIQRIGTSGMLDWRYAYRVAVHIARGLEAAFEHQIIHRNITPENILMQTSEKIAKLGDMMLAKALEGTLVEQITQPGQMVGEVTYMSPERTRGADDVDCRADIYSLGATLYSLLTGRPPFEGSSLPDLIAKIRNDDPVKPKEFQLSIADMFQDAILRMLAKRPKDRYETPTALLKDLERIGKFQGITV